MFREFLKEATELNNANKAYAIAIVVNRENPTSGKPGDKAIIKEDGSIIGWIGGGCTRGIVLQEAIKAIEDGKSRLVNISPNEKKTENNQVKSYPMTCQSGGSVEVYIEPILPKPHLLIVGVSPIALALVKLGANMKYRITLVNFTGTKLNLTESDSEVVETFSTKLISKNTYSIICTQGENDAGMLYQAIKARSSYVGFVASIKKATVIHQELKDLGATAKQLDSIKSPAGLDLNAKSPEEVAVSILAEIISLARSETSIPPICITRE